MADKVKSPMDENCQTVAEKNEVGWKQFVLKILKKYCIVHPSFLVIYLWFGILSLSIIKCLIEIPHSYFSEKSNFFNQFFVKWAWAWTVGIVGPYMMISSFVYGCDAWKKSMALSIFRIAIGTMVWHFWANFVFHFVENLTGTCLSQDGMPDFNIDNKRDCVKLKQGHYWDGFDISGHCFLLTYSVLFINSEIQIYKNWCKISKDAALYVPIGSKTLSNLKQRFRTTNSCIDILFVLNCILSFIWVIMLISTCLYFHTFLSKALGTVAAVLSWMATYNEWYKCTFSPGLPGDGPLKAIFGKLKIN
ncbi:acyl-coenzyme A diphosphatase FITM2-like [Clavelina lepadiformis]|uniref:acyl-coenzyme A diphosphatase FITM2-like n=1 Tax=Clavelina lepadiformis TaxID=159417 RepID=UPI004042B81F